MKKYLLILLLIALLTSAFSQKDQRFVANLEINSITLNGKTITYDEPLKLTVEPNSSDYCILTFNNDEQIAIKYILEEDKLVHNMIFYEYSFNDWSNLTSLEHRESAKLNSKNLWTITSETDGNEYFKINFYFELTKK